VLLSCAGVDWDAVKKYVDMGPRLQGFVNPPDCRPLTKPWVVPGWLAACCCCWQRRGRHGKRRESYQVLPAMLVHARSCLCLAGRLLLLLAAARPPRQAAGILPGACSWPYSPPPCRRDCSKARLLQFVAARASGWPCVGPACESRCLEMLS